MALPRFLVPKISDCGSVELSREDARHAHNVLRMRAGDALILFDGMGNQAHGQVQLATSNHVVVNTTRIEAISRELPRRLELLVSLPKGDRQKVLVDMLVQLGVHSVTPLKCSRSVAQPTDSAIERLQRGVVESCKQCGRNRLMEIHAAIPIARLAKRTSPETGSSLQPPVQWFAHPYGASLSLLEAMHGQLSTSMTIRVAVGPEGGFSDDECRFLISNGWQSIYLGSRILRIETAAVMIGATWAAWNRESPEAKGESSSSNQNS